MSEIEPNAWIWIAGDGCMVFASPSAPDDQDLVDAEEDGCRIIPVFERMPYHYIGKDGRRVLARDLEDSRDEWKARAEKAEAGLREAFEACRIIDEVIKEGHDNLGDMVLHFLTAGEPARAALRAQYAHVGGEVKE